MANAPRSGEDDVSGAREVTMADHDAIVGFVLALYAEDPSPAGMSEEKARRTLAHITEDSARGNAVALTRRGALSGYAFLSSVWSNELGGTVCVVDELYVVPSARGKGLASWLLRSLLDGTTPWFREAVAFELEVTPGNARAAKLYETLGFRAKKNAVLRASPVLRGDPSPR